MSQRLAIRMFDACSTHDATERHPIHHESTVFVAALPLEEQRTVFEERTRQLHILIIQTPQATNIQQRRLRQEHKTTTMKSCSTITTVGLRRWLVGILISLSISDRRCESFSLSSSPIRTLLRDSVVSEFERRRTNGGDSTVTDYHKPSAWRMAATKEDETWSKTGTTGSRLGVRRRVRKVLEKARKRTGVSNDSGEEFATGGRFISEAASLGLFDENTELVFRTPEANGAAVFPRNDTSPPLVLEDYQSSTVPSLRGVSQQSKASSVNSKTVEVDALLQSEQIEPLPFSLPQLTPEQFKKLREDERIEEQSKMGRDGSGFVVFDVPAAPYAVWECLLDFETYPEKIGTVRSMRMFTSTHLKQSYIAEKPVPPGTGMETRHYGMASISRAAFVLSKFRLNIAAIHRYQPHPHGHYMIFTLDKACTNAVLQDAKGIWYTEENPDGREGYTRVWLLCELKVSPMLPTFIVDYAAKRAMPRATAWLAPTVEKFCQQWFGTDDRT